MFLYLRLWLVFLRPVDVEELWFWMELVWNHIRKVKILASRMWWAIKMIQGCGIIQLMPGTPSVAPLFWKPNFGENNNKNINWEHQVRMSEYLTPALDQISFMCSMALKRGLIRKYHFKVINHCQIVVAMQYKDTIWSREQFRKLLLQETPVWYMYISIDFR